MTERKNEFGQPIGLALANWQPSLRPSTDALVGRLCRLESLDSSRHATDLYAACSSTLASRQNWTYLAYGPFDSAAEYANWIDEAIKEADSRYLAIIEPDSGRALGAACYLNIKPMTGSIEVGHLMFSDALKGSPVATEAMYLMMRHAFELGFRRYEWKCDALNAPSRRAAMRLGFSFEGVFRQAMVYKQRNRDTAWFSIIDAEWPRLREILETWLAPGNFDADGHQRLRLSELTRDNENA